jgi:hypothetical protein
LRQKMALTSSKDHWDPYSAEAIGRCEHYGQCHV